MKTGRLEKHYSHHAWTHKPHHGAEVNWQNEITDKLLLCLLLDDVEYNVGTIANPTEDYAKVEPLRIEAYCGTYIGKLGRNTELTGDYFNPTVRIIVKDSAGSDPALFRTNELSWEMWYKLDGALSLRYRLLMYYSGFGAVTGPPFLAYGYAVHGAYPFTYNPFWWHVWTENDVKSAYFTLDIGNVWQHLVGTYDGTAINAYLNGVLVDSSPLTGAIRYEGTEGLFVGNGPIYVGQEAKGTLGLYRHWGRALNADEVKYLFDEPYAMFWYPGESRLPYFIPTETPSLCTGVSATINADTQVVNGYGTGSTARYWRVVRLSDSAVMDSGAGSVASFGFTGEYDVEYQLQFSYDNISWSSTGCVIEFHASVPGEEDHYFIPKGALGQIDTCPQLGDYTILQTPRPTPPVDNYFVVAPEPGSYEDPECQP